MTTKRLIFTAAPLRSFETFQIQKLSKLHNSLKYHFHILYPGTLVFRQTGNTDITGLFVTL